MKHSLVLILVLTFLNPESRSQTRYAYGLVPVDIAGYRRSVAENPRHELVNLQTFIPGVVLDIRYATSNNFTGKVVYALPRAYARRPVAEALKKIQQELKPQGYGLKIFDAYRPYRATVDFYELYRDTTYVASPYRGSRHNRGCAVDLTLIELATGRELQMPTGYDSFSKDAWPSTPVADKVVRRNRELLIRVMEKHGFRVNSSEWWHFDFIGWKAYDILDIPFEELGE